MQLSDEVKAALERWHWNTNVEDAGFLADEMLRLFPPGYFDPVTPENLVKAGFKGNWYEGGRFSIDYYPRQNTTWCAYVDGKCVYTATAEFGPRNMGEVLELVARCKEGM